MGTKNIGSDFDSFLMEEGILADVEATAAKRVLAYQIQHEMENQRLTKTEMAVKMRTSRAAVNRLLDPQNTAVTLNTLEQAATALGKRLRIFIEDPARS
ncbi:MAG: XRE family transcriptional regulator [Trichloromonadaceae bacterium]